MIFDDRFSHRFFVNFIKYRFLLIELIKRDIKLKYRRSVLGIFWSFLEPLLFMIVLTIIFSTFFKHSIPNYPVYLLTGRVMFSFLAGATNASMRSIYLNASMLKKLYVPKYMYPLGVTLSNFVTFLLSIIVVFLVMIVTQAPFSLYMFLAIIPFILLLLFVIGAGLILATLTVFFRDIEHLYSVFIILLMYSSAIFFPPSIIPAKYQFVLTFNPLFAYISLFRDSFIYDKLFDPMQLLFAITASISAMVIGLLLFYKYQDKFIYS
jgi:lipopolysaccharide transport system permease protein